VIIYAEQMKKDDGISTHLSPYLRKGAALGHESAETMGVYLDIAHEEMDAELQWAEY
jgi:hypothetical protein